MYVHSHRTLVWAVVASAVAHGVLLLRVVDSGALLPARGPLRVAFRLSPASSPPAAATVSGPARRVAATPAAERGAGRPRVTESPAVSPVGTAVAAEKVPPAALVADQAGGLDDPRDVLHYRFALATAARRAAASFTAGLAPGRPEARVEVAVSGRLGGAAPQVELFRSSGSVPLDEAALSLMRRAAAVADLPPAMRGRDFRLVIPLLFGSDATPGP